MPTDNSSRCYNISGLNKRLIECVSNMPNLPYGCISPLPYESTKSDFEGVVGF